MLSIHSVPTEVSNGYLMKPHFPNTKFKCAAYIKIILYRQRGKISAEMRFHVSSHDVYEKFLNLFLFLSSPHKQPINQILFFCSHSTAVNTNRSQIHISILTRKRFATRVIMERYESTNFIFIFFYEKSPNYQIYFNCYKGYQLVFLGHQIQKLIFVVIIKFTFCNARKSRIAN